MRLFSTAELHRLTTIPLTTIRVAIADGILTPVKAGKAGRGHSDYWSIPQIFALGIGRALRSHGFNVSASEGAMDYLMNLSEREIRRAFKRGRTHLMLRVSPDRTSVRPQLVDPKAVSSAISAGKLGKRQEAISLINLKQLWSSLLRRAAQLDTKATALAS